MLHRFNEVIVNSVLFVRCDVGYKQTTCTHLVPTKAKKLQSKPHMAWSGVMTLIWSKLKPMNSISNLAQFGQLETINKYNQIRNHQQIQ